eukprot:1507757-Prymnesium_polylepis.1
MLFAYELIDTRVRGERSAHEAECEHRKEEQGARRSQARRAPEGPISSSAERHGRVLQGHTP